jgi:hypothetical protein
VQNIQFTVFLMFWVVSVSWRLALIGAHYFSLGMLHLSGMVLFFRCSFKSRFAFVPSHIMRYTLRYPPLPAHFLAALIWDE